MRSLSLSKQRRSQPSRFLQRTALVTQLTPTTLKKVFAIFLPRDIIAQSNLIVKRTWTWDDLNNLHGFTNNAKHNFCNKPLSTCEVSQFMWNNVCKKHAKNVNQPLHDVNLKVKMDICICPNRSLKVELKTDIVVNNSSSAKGASRRNLRIVRPSSTLTPWLVFKCCFQWTQIIGADNRDPIKSSF